jgi:hypothetical protein
MNNTAGKIIAARKVQIEYRHLRSQFGDKEQGIKFLQGKINGRAALER